MKEKTFNFKDSELKKIYNLVDDTERDIEIYKANIERLLDDLEQDINEKQEKIKDLIG